MRDYILTDLKIMLRIPLSVFFTMCYPILMMFIIILSYGNMPIGDGYYLIDKYFMVAIGMGVLPMTLVSFPMWISSSIENGSMDRMYFFGIPKIRIVLGDVLANLIQAICSMLIEIMIAFIVFRLRIPSFPYFFAFLAQYVVTIILFMLIGAVIAFIFKNSQIVMPLGLTLMFVFYMLCGVFIQIDEMPALMQRLADFLPIKHAMNDFFTIWQEKIIIDLYFMKLTGIYALIFGGVLILFLRKKGD